MALASTVVWEVRPTGSDSSGGGFDPSLGGVDYSQRNAAQATGTNLTVDGTTNTLVNPDSYTVVAGDVGNIIQITTTGTGAAFTTGFYEITAVSTGSSSTQRWTLDRSPAATSSAGASWSLGGALASPGMAGAAHVGGNDIYCRTTGVPDPAAQFVSSNTQYFSVASNSTLTTGAIDFSTCGWALVNTSFVASHGILIGKDGGSSPNREWALSYDTSGTQFSMTVYSNGGTGNSVAAKSASPLGTWHFVVATYKASTRTVTISVDNGTPATNTLAADPTATSAAFQIGHNGNINSFWGQLAHMGWWQGHVLTSTEITALYNSGKGLIYANLAGAGITQPTSYWDFFSTNFLSDSAGTNTLTNNNTVTSSTGPGIGITTGGGPGANFVHASNQNFTLSSTSTFDLGLNNISFCCWLKTTSSTRTAVMTKDPGSGNDRYGLYVNLSGNTNQANAFINLNGTIFTTPSLAVTVNDGNWHFLCVTINRTGNITAYVDGVSNFSSISISAQSAHSATNAASFRIGGDGGGTSSVNGNIAHAGVWYNYILTTSEITSLANYGAGLFEGQLAAAGITPPTSYWDFIPGHNGLLIDSAGANTLTNNNGVTYGADFAITSASTNVTGGCISLAAAVTSRATRLIGYQTNRTPYNTDRQPALCASGISNFKIVTNAGTGQNVNNVFVNGNNLTTASCISFASGDVRLWRCMATGGVTRSIQGGSTGIFAQLCYSFDNTTDGFSNLILLDSVSAYNGANGYINGINSGSIYNSIMIGNTSSGISFNSALGQVAKNVTCYANGTGITLPGNVAATITLLENCITALSAGYGYFQTSDNTGLLLINCADYGSTSGPTNNIAAAEMINFITLTANPFNNPSGNDFSLNNTAGGGASLRAAGVPGLTTGSYPFPGISTNAYPDIGAAQSQTSNAILGYARRRKLVYAAF